MTYIPNTVDELITRYGALIRCMIHDTIKFGFTPEDRKDMLHDVLEHVMDQDFLDRCRTYALTAPPTYTFVSSLRELVKNECLKKLRYHRAACRDVTREVSLRAALQVPDQQHLDIEARAFRAVRIERVRQYLTAKKCVIGRRPAVDVLDEALQGDGTLSKYDLRRVKHYVKDLHV
jgi:hypothetical protein